jgi:hypothetical protein
MRFLLRNIVLVSAFVVLLLAGCNEKDGKVIPRGTLAEIYAEMLVTDQWILDTPGVRMIADTSLVYAPILEKYGYSTEDYIYTVDIYQSSTFFFHHNWGWGGQNNGYYVDSNVSTNNGVFSSDRKDLIIALK